MDDEFDTSKVKPELLVLIEDATEPLKMIVTWPKVHFDYGMGDESFDLRNLASDDMLSVEWARIAGVDVDEIEKWAPVLFENGLLFTDGQVSQTATGYCLTRGASILQVVGL
jgi:hypothetical protein